MKIWLKLILVGILIFLISIVATALTGGLFSEHGHIGMIGAYLGILVTGIGIIVGLKRGFRRMMNE